MPPRHQIHHPREPPVRRDASHHHHLLLSGEGERSLRHLDHHREGRLLNREADVLETLAAVEQPLRRGEDSGEGDVVPLDRVGEGDVSARLRGGFLDLHPAWRGETCVPPELVEELPQSEVEGFTHDTPPPVRKCDHHAVPP